MVSIDQVVSQATEYSCTCTSYTFTCHHVRVGRILLSGGGVGGGCRVLVIDALTVLNNCRQEQCTGVVIMYLLHSVSARLRS